MHLEFSGDADGRGSIALTHELPTDDRSSRPRLIALTFDDGPYPVFTPMLLDVLRDLHVPATFFLIGQDAQQWPELTRRIEADGNEIADHTYYASESRPRERRRSAQGDPRRSATRFGRSRTIRPCER